MSQKAIVIGGGLSGCEAAWQLAQAGISVSLYEMRPHKQTGAHAGGDLAEVVCSNSLGSLLPDRATGLLQAEIKSMNSLLMACAEQTKVPAGMALAVDREAFSKCVTDKLQSHPNIQIIREEATKIPDSPCVIASGPLTSEALTSHLLQWTGSNHLFFFDALSPIVAADSIDLSIAFRASRYDENKGMVGDYINCPFTKEEYESFVGELLKAERIPLKSFEEAINSGVKAGAHTFFEGCLPVEIIASRGLKSLAFGPMSPKGITHPTTGRWPYAVVQLRQDNLAQSLYNLVGFQTNLKFGEQERVFRMIPGLKNAEFIRHGQMHRNTFLFSPEIIHPSLQSKKNPLVYFAGQITGVEGYVGNIATGLLAGMNLARTLKNQASLILPQTSMLGALCHYVTHAAAEDFSPMKANFGILPPLTSQTKIKKKEKGGLYSHRALNDLNQYLLQI